MCGFHNTVCKQVDDTVLVPTGGDVWFSCTIKPIDESQVGFSSFPFNATFDIKVL